MTFLHKFSSLSQFCKRRCAPKTRDWAGWRSKLWAFENTLTRERMGKRSSAASSERRYLQRVRRHAVLSIAYAAENVEFHDNGGAIGELCAYQKRQSNTPTDALHTGGNAGLLASERLPLLRVSLLVYRGLCLKSSRVCYFPVNLASQTRSLVHTVGRTTLVFVVHALVSCIVMYY